MVSNLQTKEQKSAIIEVAPDEPVSEENPLELIEEIHDRSENEENNESKMTMKNILYESGT